MEVAILKRSVKVTISGPGRSKVTREMIITKLVGLLGNKTHLRSLWRTEAGPVWFATVETPEEADSLVVKRGVVGEEYSLVFTPCNRRRLHVRVHWLPLWTPTPDVVSFFERYGTIQSCYEETQSHTTLKAGYGTGVRHVEMDVREGTQFDIPYRTTINNRQCLITIPGRPPLCLKCGGYGHYRSDCQGGNRNRPGSYSDALKNLRSAAAGDVPVPETSGPAGPPHDKSGQRGNVGDINVTPDVSQENGTEDQEHSHSQGESVQDPDPISKEDEVVIGPQHDKRGRGHDDEENMGPLQDKRRRGQDEEENMGPPQDKRGRGRESTEDSAVEESMDEEDEYDHDEVNFLSDCGISFSPDTPQSSDIKKKQKKKQKKTETKET